MEQNKENEKENKEQGKEKEKEKEKEKDATPKPPSRFEKLKYYVFDPSEDVYYVWLIIISIAIFYNYLFIIGRSTFELLQRYNPILWCIIDYICDLIYILDIFVRLRTGYLEQGLLLKDCTKLACNYLKSFQFKLDLASVLPIELPALLISKRYGTEFRLNRLLKTNRLFECRLKIETRVTYPFLFRILYLVVLLIVIIHWNACAYYWISNWYGLASDDWVLGFDDGIEHNSTSNSLFFHEYIACFYWSTLMLTTIGEVDDPKNTIQSIVMIFNFLTAIVLVATLVGNISSVISNMSIEQDTFKQRVDAIKSIMKLRRVSYDLDRRVIKWFDYLHNECQSHIDEHELFMNLPEKLSVELASQVHMQRLKKVNIFADCEEPLLAELVTKLRLQVYSPGDYVCRKGDIGKEMYIIKKGILEVVSDDGSKVFVQLKPGSFFGEISILNIKGNKNGNRRTANVRSLGYSELLRLSKTDLWNSLVDYSANREEIIEKGKEKLRKDGLLEEEEEEQIPVEEELKPGEIQEEKKLPPKDRLNKLETGLDELNKHLATLSEEMNEKSELLKNRCDKLKEIYNRKIGISELNIYNFLKGYLDEGILVRDLKKLFTSTLKQKRFYLIDILSVLPTDFLYFALWRYDLWVLIRANRLLKIPRILEFRSQTETSTNHPYFFRILSIYLFIIVIIHWNSCILYMLKKYFEVFEYKDDKYKTTFLSQYTSVFYRSTLQLTTISNIEPATSTFERFFLTINFLLGVLVFALIVGSVTEIINDLNKKRREFQEKVDGVKMYMIKAKVDSVIQQRVIKWFNHSWTNNSGMDEQLIFREFLPENLQAEIAMNIHLETLKRVHIFQDCEPGLLQQLVTRLTLRVYSPSDYICKKGDIGREMYFIKSGKLTVVSDDGSKVFHTMNEGDYFGEISILDIPGSKTGNRRTANIRSVGYSDLFCLSKVDLWQVLDEYPLAKKALIEKGREKLRKDKLLDETIVNEADNIERLRQNLENDFEESKTHLEEMNKRTDQITNIVKSGLHLINVRVDKLENNLIVY